MIDSNPPETTTSRCPAASAARTNSANPGRTRASRTASATRASWSPRTGPNSIVMHSRSVSVPACSPRSASSYASGA